jgi:glycosyltransferase involved in cell wall biosynthesis
MTSLRSADAPISVQLIQPIVPHYRVPFFEGVARRSDLRVRLCVSETIRGMPPSLPVQGMHVDADHPCREIFGGRVLWQSGLALDPGLRRGDVLVINGNPRLVSNFPLVLAARRRGIALVCWCQGWSATSERLRSSIRLQLMKLADVVLLYTDDERDDLIARGFEPERVFALNNALDDGRISAAAGSWPAERLAQFRQTHGLDGRKVLLFCGRLRATPSIDLDVALHALAELTRQSPAYTFAIVGDGVEAARLRELARSLGCDSHIKWLGSVYDEEQLAPWFLSARCFVYPGSIGLSLIQALAYGLPVVTHANRREHGPEIAALREGSTGLMFPRGDASALASQIASVCGDESLRSHMSREARQIVEEKYSMKSMVLRFAQAVAAASRLKVVD